MRILFILLISFSNLMAQSDSLTRTGCNVQLMGRVLNGESDLPLENASVSLVGTSKYSSTDKKGRFVIKDICKGPFCIEVSYLGYKTLHEQVVLDENKFVDLILHEEVCELPSVIVKGRKPVNGTSLPKNSIEGKQLLQTRGLSLGESLREVPGVNVLQTGPTIFKPVIHGLYGNRVLIFNNGIRQEGQQWGNEHAPEIDPFIASKITVIKGANSVRYGSDAIGGVILVEPPALRTQGAGGEINLAGFSNNRMGAASAMLEYAPSQIKGLSGRVQGSFRNGGNAKTPDYYIANTGLNEYNYSVATGYQRKKFGLEVYYSLFNSKVGIFKGAHIGNLTDLQTALGNEEPLVSAGFTREIERPYQFIMHELVKTSAYYETGIGKLTWDYGRQYNDRSEFDNHTGGRVNDDPELQFKITTHTSNLVLEHKPIGNFRGTIGVNGMSQSNTWRGRFFIPNFSSSSGGLFFIERWKRKRLELEVGGRYDYKAIQVYLREGDNIISPEHTFSNFSGTTGAIYKLSPNWKLTANAGTAFRPPAVNELYSYGVHHGTASFEVGRKDLKPEVAYNTILSAAFAYTRIYGEISVYNNCIKDYIYLQPVFPPTLTIRGAFPTFHYTQTNANLRGVDIAVNDSIGRNIIFSTRLSWVRGYNVSAGDYLIFMPPFRWDNGIRYWINMHSHIISEPFVEVRNMYVARQTRVPENSDYAPPPPGYMLLNLNFGGTIQAGELPIEFSFGIHNVLNTRYRDYLDRFRYYTDAVGRNIMLRVRVPLNFK